MTPEFCTDVLGMRVQIEAPEDLTDEQRDELRTAWSGALIEPEATDLTVQFGSVEKFARSMERLTIDVTLTALAAVGGHALMFHAAGVADETGRVAAFVGPSGRGKTTLSRNLAAGLGYVSDETIAVRSDLTVLPYRKPLSIVQPEGPKKQISPADAGLRDLPDTRLHLAALVVIERDPDQVEVSVEPLDLVDALPLLVTQMSYLREQDKPLQALARLFDDVGGTLQLRYAEAADVAAHMPEIFDHAARSSGWRSATGTASDGPYSAEGVTDAIVVDGRVVVMKDDTVRVLDGIAPVVWRSAAAGHALNEITADVVETFGEPPVGDASALVAAALDELVDVDVLSRR